MDLYNQEYSTNKILTDVFQKTHIKYNLPDIYKRI